MYVVMSVRPDEIDRPLLAHTQRAPAVKVARELLACGFFGELHLWFTFPLDCNLSSEYEGRIHIAPADDIP